MTTPSDETNRNSTSQAVAVLDNPRPPALWTPRFAMTVDAAVDLVNQKREFFDRVMREGQHYGRIPGMPKETRPALLKPGAELLNAAMGLHPELADAEPPVRDYSGAQHGGQPYWSFRRVCRIYRQTGSGETDRMLVAQAEGACNSWETKFRYRDQQRACPTCGQAAIREAKVEDGKAGGFYCWRKIGGCGANFHHDDPRILSQKVGRVLNPEVFELENTGLKMADKRALVAATLLATGCSDLFTQDLEDQVADVNPGSAGSEPRSTDELSGDQRAAAAPAQASPAPTGYAGRLEALSASLADPWSKRRLEAAVKAVRTFGSRVYVKFLQELGEAHSKDHGPSCEHVRAAEREERVRYDDDAVAVVDSSGDVDPDDIPF